MPACVQADSRGMLGTYTSRIESVGWVLRWESSLLAAEAAQRQVRRRATFRSARLHNEAIFFSGKARLRWGRGALFLILNLIVAPPHGPPVDKVYARQDRQPSQNHQARDRLTQ